MNRQEAIWWVNHLFEIRKEEYFNKGMMEDAKEVEEAQHMAIEALSAPQTDLISRADAVCEVLVNDGIVNIVDRIAALPSADAVGRYEETDGVIKIKKQSAKDVGEIKHIVVCSPNYTRYFYNDSMPTQHKAGNVWHKT